MSAPPLEEQPTHHGHKIAQAELAFAAVTMRSWHHDRLASRPAPCESGKKAPDKGRGNKKCQFAAGDFECHELRNPLPRKQDSIQETSSYRF